MSELEKREAKRLTRNLEEPKILFYENFTPTTMGKDNTCKMDISRANQFMLIKLSLAISDIAEQQKEISNRLETLDQKLKSRSEKDIDDLTNKLNGLDINKVSEDIKKLGNKIEGIKLDPHKKPQPEYGWSRAETNFDWLYKKKT